MCMGQSEIAAICTSYVFGDAPTCDAREPRDVKFAGRMVIQNYVPVAVDRLGSVVANPTQGSVGSALPKYYAPFGEQYNEAQSGVGFPGNTNFATYFHEETTGLNYANQRFYNSQYGRFMSADLNFASNAIALTGNWNKFSYVGNNPVNKTDPSGMCSPEDKPPCFSTTGYGESPDEVSDFALLFYSGPVRPKPGPDAYDRVEKLISRDLNMARRALLKPDCAALFGVPDPFSILFGIANPSLGSNYGSLEIMGITSPPGTTISATVTPVSLTNANGTFNSAIITLNSLAGSFVTGTPTDQVVTLLHELGHAINDIFGPNTSRIADDGPSVKDGVQISMSNTALVRSKCF